MGRPVTPVPVLLPGSQLPKSSPFTETAVWLPTSQPSHVIASQHRNYDAGSLIPVWGGGGVRV